MKEYKGEFRSKDGVKTGEWKATVDEKLKLVKNTPTGKMEIGGLQELLDCIISELKKFNKGESIYLIDMSSCDTKFMSQEIMKKTNDFAEIVVPHCKKCAGVMPSFVLRKAVEIFAKGKTKYYATEKEAMDYLLKD